MGKTLAEKSNHDKSCTLMKSMVHHFFSIFKNDVKSIASRHEIIFGVSLVEMSLRIIAPFCGGCFSGVGTAGTGEV
jgi:hypothetical protein